MDWLTETPAYGTTLAPQLLGVKILEICSAALLLLTLLTAMVGWVFVMVTCGLFLLGLFDFWHPVAPGRPGNLAASSR